MGRILVVAVIFIVIYLLIRHYHKQTSKNDAIAKDVSKHRENMVRCAHCGVHLPKGESIMLDHKHYCNEAHRRAHTDEPE
ncbi:MAG: PP0621 family protein [Candidatus Nitrotoga sp.]